MVRPHLTHVARACHDLDRSIEFYARYAGLRVVHQREEHGVRVAWLGEGTPKSDAAPLDDVPRAVARVRQILEAAEARDLRETKHSIAPA